MKTKVMLLLVLAAFAFPKSRAEAVVGYIGLETEIRAYLEKPETCRGCESTGLVSGMQVSMEELFLGDSLRIVLDLEADFNSEVSQQGAFLDENEDRESPYVKSDIYAELRKGLVVLGAGIRDADYSVTDRFHPTEVHKPFNYTDLLDSDSFGIPSAWAGLQGERLFLEAEGSMFCPSRLPLEEGSRWRLPDLYGATVLGPDRVDNPWQIRATAGFQSYWMDLSLEYSKHWSPYPEFSVIGPDLIGQEYFKVSLYGANLAFEVLGFGITGEGAYLDQEGGQDDLVQWAAGVNRYEDFGDGSLTVKVQYHREEVVKEGEAPLQEFDLRRVFTRDSLAGKIELDLWDFSLTAEGLYDLGDQGVYVRPEVSYRVTENIEVAVGYEHIDGPEDSFFGRFRYNSRVYFGVSLGFGF